MNGLFSEQEVQAMRTVTRDQLEAAYEEELYEKPPVHSAQGDEPEAISSRKRYARQDVARVYAAAKRLGCVIQLAPLPGQGKTP